MSIDGAPRAEGDPDLSALRSVLVRHRFPTRQDDVLALLVARRESSRLMWRVGALSRTRVYGSVDEICAELADVATTQGMPPPPGR